MSPSAARAPQNELHSPLTATWIASAASVNISSQPDSASFHEARLPRALIVPEISHSWAPALEERANLSVRGEGSLISRNDSQLTWLFSAPQWPGHAGSGRAR